MNYKPLRRDYKQMVRIVRDQTNSSISYKMGTAYGDSKHHFDGGFDSHFNATQVRIRTLNEMNLPSTSLRRPEAPAVDGFLPTRESSILYHQLNDNIQHYLNGQGGAQAVRRSDGNPGTKLRTELGKDAFEHTIYTQSSFQPASDNKSDNKEGSASTGQAHHPFNVFKS